jgi:hypothetical protein
MESVCQRIYPHHRPAPSAGQVREIFFGGVGGATISKFRLKDMKSKVFLNNTLQHRYSCFFLWNEGQFGDCVD